MWRYTLKYSIILLVPSIAIILFGINKNISYVVAFAALAFLGQSLATFASRYNTRCIHVLEDSIASEINSKYSYIKYSDLAGVEVERLQDELEEYEALVLKMTHGGAETFILSSNIDRTALLEFIRSKTARIDA